MIRNVSNFAIGFFAAICAVFVPRMVAMLGGNGDIQIFHTNYIVMGIAFALIIGGVTAIFMKSKQKSAAETFMTALGIPALLAGALNSGTASSEMHNIESDKQKLIESLSQKSEVPIDEKALSIEPIQTAPSDHKPSSGMGFSLISSAYAQEVADSSNGGTGLNLGIRPEQKSYVIVLEKTGDKNKALQLAAELRQTLPKVAVVQAKDDYLVIENPEPQEKSGALLRAVELKKNSNLKPYLLQVK